MPKARTRVAIVDDEPSVRVALARLLDASSFETKTYATAREFIEATRKGAPECLVLDIHMPDFTGLDLQRYLQRTNKSIPIIIITAFDDTDIRERCAAYGATAFLTKPLQGAVLIDAIRTATAHAKAGRAGGVPD